ncbi:MAG: SDR family oxidoreductase [Pseudomonadota bacterium]
METLIIGASQGIGLATVKEALARGHTVRAFARSADQIPVKNERLQKIRGDALNKNDVERAVRGVDSVIQCLGVPLDFKLLTGPITLFSEATKVLIPVMQNANVRRIISVTGFGAGDSEAAIGLIQKLPFNLLFGHAYTDKSIQEKIVKESGLDWTIARPGVLTNGAKSKTYKVLFESGDWRNGVISRASVADFLINAIETESLVRKEPVLVG